MASLTLAGPDLTTLRADAIVVGVMKSPAGPRLAPGAEEIDQALGGRLLEALTAVGATGAADEVVKLATLGAGTIPVVAAAGLGAVPADGSGVTEEAARRASGAASRALAGRARVASTLAQTVVGGATAAAVQAVSEGALLGGYTFGAYKTENDRPAPPSSYTVLVPNPKDKASRAAAKRASAVAEAVGFCRDLVNTAPNDLPPAELADRAAVAGRKAGLDVEILDEKALRRAGFGGVLGVGGGSVRPPRLVRMQYRGRPGGTRVALVGKGITFDSGGISIKPAAGMDAMKSDMAGAAAVIATMILAAALRLPLELTATVPMAENLPSGSAYRPADVLSMYGGRRVEVLNTDAEGRLILADAIVRACEDSPAYLLETSTLTGAQRIALGERTSGVMGSDDLRDRVIAAAGRSGEHMWPMPMPDELRKGLDSPVADIANVMGDRGAGMLVGAVFLREFVTEGVPWVHIDVASPAYNAGAAWGYSPKGGTGVPIRTLLAVLEDIAENG
ncbi:MAG: leucyl aminopeptidase [Mycobacteriales bacterium]